MPLPDRYAEAKCLEAVIAGNGSGNVDRVGSARNVATGSVTLFSASIRECMF
jgi:hypothetical protein